MSGPSQIQVAVSHEGDTDFVSPAGEIDIATAPQVRRAMLEAAGRRLVLDLRSVVFMDTSGLQLLLEGQRRAREQGGAFAIVAGPPRVQRLLDVAGLTGRLQLAGAPDKPAGDAKRAA